MNGLLPDRKKHILLFFGLLLSGFIYRLAVASLFPQPLIWDQEQYYGFALGMIQEGLHADTVRLYGYPLFIVPFISLFGTAFQWPFTCFQALVDCGTAVLIFFIGKKVFSGVPLAVWIGYILYLANPFTPAFVGVILTEITAIFFVTLVMYLFLMLFYRWNMRISIITAFLLGYLPQIRPSFQYFTLVAVGVLAYAARKKSKHIAFIAVIAVLYLMPYSYNVAVNLYRYHQFSLQSVDNVFIREVYISLFVDRAAPPGDYTFAWPGEVYNAWFDFSSPTTPEGRAAMSVKYKNLARQKILQDPGKFIRGRIAKTWYIWEKHYLFPYIPDQGGVTGERVIYITNIFLLTTSLAGFFLWFADKQTRTLAKLKYFGYTVLFLIAYISVAHVFSTSEERFSLPGYPVIILFSGYAIVRIIQSCNLFFSPTSPGKELHG